ncbi:MAG: ABC transporter ATP-binding protein, partial [Planctomycetes bacterium]|nr:ABC transporter ATP-binding protein [Planctomycetota bacterium]
MGFEGVAPATGGGGAVLPAPSSIVEFRDVTKVFGEGTPKAFTAVSGITFSVEDIPTRGESIAVIGPSGCGKSTILRMIAGFYRPTRGEVLVRGRPVEGPGCDRGMIFQKYSSFPHLSVLDNVMFGLNLNRSELGYSSEERESQARSWIGKVGLAGHEGKYPHQLGGGMQQRVAIARTLALKPRIMLLDEPFSALDEPTRIEMQKLIVELWWEVKATVFVITHSITEAVYLGDRVFI